MNGSIFSSFYLSGVGNNMGKYRVSFSSHFIVEGEDKETARSIAIERFKENPPEIRDVEIRVRELELKR